jgi:hypothetical protein
MTHNKVIIKHIHEPFKTINPFQCNLNANRILPSSFPTSKTARYNAQSPIHIKTYGLPRNRKSTTCAIC